MRGILFRGKRVDNGKWITGNLFIPDATSRPTQVLVGTDIVRISYEVIPETVGQYTGLTDKNDNKIFEGDIVRGAWKTLFVVYFDKDYLQFRAKEFVNSTIARSIDYYGDNSRLEVIGNIHDNPELLKGGDGE